MLKNSSYLTALFYTLQKIAKRRARSSCANCLRREAIWQQTKARTPLRRFLVSGRALHVLQDFGRHFGDQNRPLSFKLLAAAIAPQNPDTGNAVRICSD